MDSPRQLSRVAGSIEVPEARCGSVVDILSFTFRPRPARSLFEVAGAFHEHGFGRVMSCSRLPQFATYPSSFHGQHTTLCCLTRAPCFATYLSDIDACMRSVSHRKFPSLSFQMSAAGIPVLMLCAGCGICCYGSLFHVSKMGDLNVRHNLSTDHLVYVRFLCHLKGT